MDPVGQQSPLWTLDFRSAVHGSGIALRNQPGTEAESGGMRTRTGADTAGEASIPLPCPWPLRRYRTGGVAVGRVRPVPCRAVPCRSGAAPAAGTSPDM